MKFHKKKAICFGLLFFYLSCFSAELSRYLYFTEIDGLPRNITTCLAQDQYGYLWIGTTNGIARYDGKNFIHNSELAEVGINKLLYDSKDNLWAATSKGLYLYNRLTNYFQQITEGYISSIREDEGEVYFLMVSNIYKISGQEVDTVYLGNDLSEFCFSDQGIWISKTNDGVSLLSRESGFTKIDHSFLKGKPVSHIDRVDNKILAGCYNGQLYTIDENGETKQIDIENHYYFVKFVKVDQEIWLATDGNGIIILNKDFQFKRSLRKYPNKNLSINTNSIYDIFQASNGEIWLASYGAGLTCILPDNLLFQNIQPEKGNENSLVANEGISVYIKDQVIYFGTNYGLSAWHENSGKFNNLPSEKLIKNLNGTKVSAISLDYNNNLWVGTYDGLLGKYSADFDLQKTYHPCSEDPEEMQQIVHLREVGKNNILVLTQFHSRILLNFNPKSEKSEVFELYKKGSNITYCLLNSLRENQQGELLAIISDKGLFHVNWNDNVLENRLSEMNQRIDCYITDFHQTKDGSYWITSSTKGLVHVTPDGKTYQIYSTKDGLPSNTLIRIESVDDQYLWISTVAGICRFNTRTLEAMNFNHRDGLPANEFQERASASTEDGRIIFGSMAGFTIIDPTKINRDSTKTEVIISDITFQNQSIRSPEGKQYLKKPLEETGKIRLPYSNNSFSIHFFTKNKSFSKYQTYTYRLIGLEENWMYLGETNYTTYTNLSPGTYTFEIKSADNNQAALTTRLMIHIQSPWYLRWFSILVYIILFFTIIYLSIYAFLKRIELIKEKEISEYKIQKEHELTEKKLAFFTNISHDLKTPLTLIDAPVNDLLQDKNLDRDQINKLMVVKRNSIRLYKLISDLIDFRKITQKKYALEISETFIAQAIKDTCDAFREECRNKSIDLKCSVDDNIQGYLDAKKIEKILWNLLSNALKFTKKKGEISVSVEEHSVNGIRHIQLVVSDTGIGISEPDKNKIFERFYKSNDQNPENREGTGIGLSIVKELVELHHGEIQVESAINMGTVFKISIPADKESYVENEISSSQNAFVEISEPYHEPALSLNPKRQASSKNERTSLPVILLVEDNAELRDYLAHHFEKQFRVFTAEDGFIGLKMVKEKNPDIVITDVQMPKLNGYAFCKEIRKNFDTSHIPVIMLTAKISLEEQIEGLSTGADAYITKPFDIKLLDTQVNSILENRQALRHRFLRVGEPENLNKSLPQKDINFIFELKLFIEENIINQDLNIELLASHFAVSIAQLHRKIKSLTGTTPNNLIKSIRLNKAYKLIRDDGLRVSEAAYQTGFNDPNYFTICFKREFGDNPSRIFAALEQSREKGANN